MPRLLVGSCLAVLMLALGAGCGLDPAAKPKAPTADPSLLSKNAWVCHQEIPSRKDPVIRQGLIFQAGTLHIISFQRLDESEAPQYQQSDVPWRVVSSGPDWLLLGLSADAMLWKVKFLDGDRLRIGNLVFDATTAAQLQKTVAGKP